MNVEWLRGQLTGALVLSAPLVLSASLHMACVRRGLFSGLALPIHAPAFGANKTWRGFFLMILITAFSVPAIEVVCERMGVLTTPLASGIGSWALGACLGLAYCLAELPNSFLKRRLGIAAGKSASNRAWLYAFFDQADSVFGCVFVYAVFAPGSHQYIVVTLLLGPIVHLLGNFSAYHLGLRAQPF